MHLESHGCGRSGRRHRERYAMAKQSNVVKVSFDRKNFLEPLSA